MPPELPEPEIRRVVRERMRERSLYVITASIPSPTASSGTTRCIVCGFPIAAGRSECEVPGAHAHERCAVIWREEADRLS